MLIVSDQYNDAVHSTALQCKQLHSFDIWISCQFNKEGKFLSIIKYGIFGSGYMTTALDRWIFCGMNKEGIISWIRK